MNRECSTFVDTAYLRELRKQSTASKDSISVTESGLSPIDEGWQ